MAEFQVQCVVSKHLALRLTKILRGLLHTKSDQVKFDNLLRSFKLKLLQKIVSEWIDVLKNKLKEYLNDLYIIRKFNFFYNKCGILFKLKIMKYEISLSPEITLKC